jgi:hypothetical protein
VTISYSPDPVYAGEEVTLSATTVPTTGTIARWQITSVPSGSAVDTTAALVNADGSPASTFTPDVPGAYGVRAAVSLQIDGIPRFPFDPAGRSREVLLTPQTSTVYVAERLDIPIRTLFGDGATLRLAVANNTVKAASFVDPLTELGRTAALDATVVSSLAAAVGSTASTLAALDTGARDLLTNYERHRVLTSGAVHAGSGDTVNASLSEPPYSTKGAIDALNELRDKLVDHMRAGTTGGTWHTADDTKNLPIASKAADPASGLVLRCDLWRAFEAHRVQIATPTVHGASDTTALSALNAIEAVVRDYLSALVTTSPSTPTGEQTGAEYLKRRYGARATR